MGYGILTATDVQTLEAAMRDATEGIADATFKMFEIGVHSGATARGMRAFLLSECDVIDLQYVGVDSQRDMPIGPPFPGATMVYGDSTEVYAQVKPHGPFNFGFVDGCHCCNHVALDILHYGDLIMPGGRLALHDTGLTAQGRAESYQTHGPHTPDFSIAVREAMRLLGLLPDPPRFRVGKRGDWLIDREADEGSDFGGVTVLVRVG